MNTYKRHRFPSDIISYAVWLYYRFSLSHRDVEDLLAERGVIVSREAIRFGYQGYGDTFFTSQYANNRVEQSHEATRVRERGMRKFKSVGQARRVVTAHAAVSILFNLGRHLVRAQHYRELRASAFAQWSGAVA